MSKLEKIKKKLEQDINRKKIIYKGFSKTYHFAKFKIIRSFGDVTKNVTSPIYMVNNE